MNLKSFFSHLIVIFMALFTILAFGVLVKVSWLGEYYIFSILAVIIGFLVLFLINKDFKRAKKRTHNFTICPIETDEE